MDFKDNVLENCAECGTDKVTHIDNISEDLYCRKCASDRGFRNCENEPSGIVDLNGYDDEECDIPMVSDFFDEDSY